MKNAYALENWKPADLVRINAFPQMLSLICTGLSSIIDSLFLGSVSSSCLAAVSLANPVLLLMNACSAGIGSGTSSVLSYQLGKKQADANGVYVLSALCVAGLLWLPFLLSGLFASRWFLSLFSASDSVHAQAAVYLKILTCCSLTLFLMDVSQKLLLAAEHTRAGLAGHVFSVLLHIGLGPLMILNASDALDAMKNAAVCTVICQISGGFLYWILNRMFNQDFPLHLRGKHPSWQAMKKIAGKARVTISTHGLSSLMSFGLNQMLSGVSETALAFFGVYAKLESVILLPVQALEEAMIPVASFNASAHHCLRVKAVFKETLERGLAAILVSVLLLEALPGWILSFYSASDSLLHTGVPALRILALSLPFCALSDLMASLFDAAQKEPLGLVSTLVSRVFILFPLAWISQHFWKLNGIWWAVVFSSLLGCLYCCCRLDAVFDWNLISLFQTDKKRDR